MTLDPVRIALAPYTLWLKLGAVALAVVLIFGTGWKVGAGLTQARWQRAAIQAERERTAEVERARAAEQAANDHSQEVSRDYEARLSELDQQRRAAIRRIGPVRVCNPVARASRVPAAADPSSRPDGAGARDLVSGPTGGDLERDIGPDLTELAADADRCRLQLGSLQRWVVETRLPNR